MAIEDAQSQEAVCDLPEIAALTLVNFPFTALALVNASSVVYFLFCVFRLFLFFFLVCLFF